MWEILFILFCISLNAILAGIEIAYISVNKTLLRYRARQGDQKAKALLEVKEKPERTLSTIQIGITLLGALTAAVGGATAGINIVPLLHQKFQISLALAEVLAIVFVVAPITYLSVVLGEITPKALALRNPYFFAVLGTPILKVMSKILYPMVRLCEKSTKAILKLIPANKTGEGNPEKEYNEWEKLLTNYRGLPQKGKEYMINLSTLHEKILKQILLDWDAVDYVTVDQDLEVIIEMIISSGHTRMPVVKDKKVVGLINTKEILAFSKGSDNDWKQIMRKPVIFKEDTHLLFALNDLQSTRVHMGIVEDEHNRPIGIVTIEDIIEEVLGEIYDEDDEGSLKKILFKGR